MPPETAATTPSSRRWVVPVLMVAALVLPLLVAMVSALRTDWYPHSDRAVIEARTADVFGGDLPLVGPYSRYGFNHPGPLSYLVLAVPLELSGQRPEALLVGTLAIGAVCVAAAVVLASRRAGPAGALATTLALAVLLLAFGPEQLRDPWNPFLPLLPFALVLVAAWSASCGSWWSLPVLAASGSLVVQSHVGTAVPVAAVGLWALGALVWQARRQGRGSGRRWVWPLATTAVVVALAWLAPVADQLTGEGNLGRIARFFVTGEGERVSLDRALGVAARQLAPVGPWLTGDEPQVFGEVQPLAWPVALVLPVALALVVWRRWVGSGDTGAPGETGGRRLDPLARAAVTFGVGAIAVVVALSGVRDELYGYLFRWTWVVAAFGWVTVGWAVLDRIGATTWWSHRSLALRRTGWVVAGVAVCSAGIVLCAQAWTATGPDQDDADAIAAVVGPAAAGLAPGQAVVVDTSGVDIGQLSGGLAVALERLGHPVAVPVEQAYIWGNRRAARDEHDPAAARLVLVRGTDADALDLPGLELVATYDALGPAERAEIVELRADIERRFASTSGSQGAPPDLGALGITEEMLDRLADLAARDIEVAVYRER